MWWFKEFTLASRFYISEWNLPRKILKTLRKVRAVNSYPACRQTKETLFVFAKKCFWFCYKSFLVCPGLNCLFQSSETIFMLVQVMFCTILANIKSPSTPATPGMAITKTIGDGLMLTPSGKNMSLRSVNRRMSVARLLIENYKNWQRILRKHSLFS